MGPAAVSLHYARPPSVLRYYPRALMGERLPVLPEGTEVPRLEGKVEALRVPRGNLRRYRAVCGFAADGGLPVTYPHALALPLHVAVMTHPAFVVRLMGLVHVANEIECIRPLPDDRPYGLRVWLEGHDETDRGQEFRLYTELLDETGPAWRECCTLLARQKASGPQAARSARATLRAPKPPADVAVAQATFRAEQSIARRYGLISGDLNPIHLADFLARWYGFERAVAHGMWSMARSLAALGPELTARPCRIPAEFKLPLFMPSEVRLDHWQEGTRHVFVLRDAGNQRPHLAGSVEAP